MKVRVGIEALAFAVPHRYVEIEDLARARGVDPNKFTQGLGARQMAVAEPGEDAVALAATAGRRLLALGADPSKIGFLAVGTETGVDHSKPIASFVQGLLKLPRTMRTFDTQHACYGGTAALMAATEWIASGAGAGRTAMVLCADVARYGLSTAGEPTQGAAAVALLVSESPDVLELDVGLSGSFSADVHDFWRPVGRRDALVDGHYSMECYLQALAGAYRGWRDRALAREVIRPSEAPTSEQLARVLYHVPFCKMAKKAHAAVRLAELEERAGGPLDEAALAAEAPVAAARFASQVAPSLDLCSRIGNAYTASLYLSLTGLLHAQGAELAGQRIGLFSYGSGCASEFFSGVVGKRAAERISAIGVEALLERRERVSIPEYERILSLPPDAPLANDPPEGEVRYAGTVDHKRTYRG